MEQGIFHIIKSADDKFRFTSNGMTITINGFLYKNGKHQIHSPHAANAQFICYEKNYTIENTEGIETIEDWYREELLPKFQMLNLLLK